MRAVSEAPDTDLMNWLWHETFKIETRKGTETILWSPQRRHWRRCRARTPGFWQESEKLEWRDV